MTALGYTAIIEDSLGKYQYRFVNEMLFVEKSLGERRWN